MMYSSADAGTRPSAVSRALARNRVGAPAILFFILAGVAPLTVAAGVVPSAFAATGLTGIPAAFIVTGILFGVFAAGYMAMGRHVVHAGALYAYVRAGLGRPPGVAAALIALGSYNCLQVGLYGAFGWQAANLASAHLRLQAAWWVWALAAWGLVTVLGQLEVDVTGRVLSVLSGAELLVILALSVSGLTRPAGGHVAFSALSPAELTTGGWGTVGVLGVIAVLGFSGIEEGPILAEEARDARRATARATYLAIGLVLVAYTAVSWVMTVNAGPGHVVAAARAESAGLLFGLGSGTLANIANVLFLTSLFAALLSFHNAVWRYGFALSREGVLPERFSRTGTGNVPRQASLGQSAIGLVVLVIYAAGGWNPLGSLFYGFGTAGGLGILLLLALTSIAVIVFFARDHRGEHLWCRLIAPAISGAALTLLVVLAVWHFAVVLGIPSGSLAAWLIPALFAVVAAAGFGWGLYLKVKRPQIYAALGLGAHAITAQPFLQRWGQR